MRPHRPFALLLGLLGITTMGCTTRTPTDTRATVGSELAVPVQAANAPVGERLLDTGTAQSPSTARALAVTTPPTPAPVTTTRAPKIRKPGSDEHLPSWVPLRGRLTVVEAPDLAENLGIVPAGTTKSARARVSVADALSQAPASTTATSPSPSTSLTIPPAARTDTGPRSATWLASNGRVRHGRGR